MFRKLSRGGNGGGKVLWLNTSTVSLAIFSGGFGAGRITGTGTFSVVIAEIVVAVVVIDVGGGVVGGGTVVDISSSSSSSNEDFF